MINMSKKLNFKEMLRRFSIINKPKHEVEDFIYALEASKDMNYKLSTQVFGIKLRCYYLCENDMNHPFT